MKNRINTSTPLTTALWCSATTSLFSPGKTALSSCMDAYIRKADCLVFTLSQNINYGIDTSSLTVKSLNKFFLGSNSTFVSLDVGFK